MKITAGTAAYVALANGAKHPASISGNNLLLNANNSPQHTIEAVTVEEINSAREAWLSGASKVPQPKKEEYPV